MDLPVEYLTKRTTFEQAVADNLLDGIPFGHCNDDWERLKAKMQPGDEFWYFAPPNKKVMQFWGLALIRNGQVISTVVTAVD
jgi:hypothetical protein